MTLLASRLEEVNAMALAGELPDVDISDKGVKITPLENGVLRCTGNSGHYHLFFFKQPSDDIFP